MSKAIRPPARILPLAFALISALGPPLQASGRGERAAPAQVQSRPAAAGVDRSVGAGESERATVAGSARLRPDSLGAELTVTEAIRIARGASGELERARIEIGRAEAEIDLARARLFPELTGRASASYLVFPPEGIGLQAGELGTIPDPGGFPIRIPESNVDVVPDAESTFFRVSASLTQALITWGKVGAGIEAAELGDRIARVGRTDRERDLAAEVRRAYFAAVLAERTAEQLMRIEETLDQIVSDRTEAFDAGARTRQDVLEVEAERAAVRRQRISASQGHRSARRGLGFLLGLSLDDEVKLVSDFREDPQTAGEAETLASVRAFSPQLRVLDMRTQQAEIGLFVAERTNRLYYPDIALRVDFEVSGQRVPLSANWRETWDTDLTLSVAGEFALFDAGAQAARIRQARGDLLSARSALVDSQDGVELDVLEHMEALQVADAELVEKRAAGALRSEQRRNAETSFENEIITREQLLMARIGESVARIDEISAAFRLEQAITSLEALTGDILNP